jgi:branched-chain amino acid transport system substrate-binding protein
MLRIKRLISLLLAVVLTLWTGGGIVSAQQGTIKVMYTDPLSGPFAQVGDQNLQQFKYILDYINGRGGAVGRKFEIVSFDNKSAPAEALLALKAATDQNMPIIMQCSGSNIAAALIEGVDKHNERNPNNRIVYVNCGAVATELTNEKCSYWHFRHGRARGHEGRDHGARPPKDVTKVYLLNQDYLFGQVVQRDVKTFLTKLRPDVKVVGDELIPLGKVKDFSPTSPRSRPRAPRPSSPATGART